MMTICENPISLMDKDKYTDTLIALRDGTLLPEYQEITIYREDESSEQRVQRINTAFPIIISVWLVLIAICLWKIR